MKYKLVPVEATEAMQSGIANQAWRYAVGYPAAPADFHAAMLAAVPEPDWAGLGLALADALERIDRPFYTESELADALREVLGG